MILGHIKAVETNQGAFNCPHCAAGLEIEWSTEYGEPMIGDHSDKCPKCEKPFSFSVRHEFTAWKGGAS